MKPEQLMDDIKEMGMGMCDPKAIRDGKAWADVVNKTPMACPKCTHGNGFRCQHCWPQPLRHSPLLALEKSMT